MYVSMCVCDMRVCLWYVCVVSGVYDGVIGDTQLKGDGEEGGRATWCYSNESGR